MQIVIDIPDKMYHMINAGFYDYGDMNVIIQKGMPLPKGHGRLIDADALVKKMEEREEKLKDDRSMWETASVETALDMFAQTIIEAESEE